MEFTVKVENRLTAPAFQSNAIPDSIKNRIPPSLTVFAK